MSTKKNKKKNKKKSYTSKKISKKKEANMFRQKQASKKNKKKSCWFEVNFKGIFGSSFHKLSSLSFLSILKRKHLGLTIYFPSSHLTKHTLKKFYFLFSLLSFSFTLFHLQTNTP